MEWRSRKEALPRALLLWLALLMLCTGALADCDLWPGDPSLSACSASAMYRLNAQRTGHSPFAGPGAALPVLSQMPSLASPLMGPSYLGESDEVLEGSPFFLENACSDGSCAGLLVREAAVNSSSNAVDAQLSPTQGLGRQGWPTLSTTGVAYVSWISAGDGASAATLYALDIPDAASSMWTYPIAAQSPLLTFDGHVIVFEEGNLLSLDGSTGEVAWNETVTNGTVTGVALGYDGNIYATISEVGFIGYAMVSTEGMRFFTCTLPGSASSGMPVIRSDGSLVLISEDTVFAVNGTCNTVWSYSPAADAFALQQYAQLPALGSAGQVYINSQESLLAVSSTGAKLWETDLEGVRACFPPVTDVNDVVYLLAGGCGEGSSDAVLLAFDGATGEVLWSLDTPEAGDAEVYQTHPVISGDGDVVFSLRRYFVASLTNYAMDAQSYSPAYYESSGAAPVEADGPEDLLFLVFLAVVLVVCCVLITLASVAVRIQTKGKKVYDSIA